jgi:DNA-binding PadR family transcriptional regulator
MLKKLVSQGLIKASSPTKRSSETEQRVYGITSKGRNYLDEGKQMFANAGNRWSYVRKIFIELIRPEDLAKFFSDSARMQFEGSREMIEAKLVALPPGELQMVLKEYELNLERQLEWTKSRMAQIDRKYGANLQAIQVNYDSENKRKKSE